MSAIADFWIIETHKLPALKEAAQVTVKKGFFSKKVIDTYWSYLNENARKLNAFHRSGYIFAYLFVFLEEEKGIDLFNGEFSELADYLSEKRDNSTFILTYQHKQQYVGMLDPAKYNLKELMAFNTDFSRIADVEWATAQMEGIRMLKESLNNLADDKQVVLLSIA